MFEDSLVESNGQIHTKKGKTVLASALVHTLLIVVVILIPLIYTDQIEARHLVMFLMEPPPPPPPAPATPEQEATPVAVIRTTRVDPRDLISPIQIPTEIARVVDGPASLLGLPGGITRPAANDIIRNLLKANEPETVPVAVPPPPPPPPPPAAPLRVGGLVSQANELYKPSPVYPQLAKTARVQGMVVLEAVISKEGVIRDLRVVSGHPLLTQAAIDAVRNWRYRPTLLNGEPVDVITTVTLNFSLGR